MRLAVFTVSPQMSYWNFFTAHDARHHGAGVTATRMRKASGPERTGPGVLLHEGLHMVNPAANADPGRGGVMADRRRPCKRTPMVSGSSMPCSSTMASKARSRCQLRDQFRR